MNHTNVLKNCVCVCVCVCVGVCVCVVCACVHPLMHGRERCIEICSDTNVLQSANWSVSRFSQWLDSHPLERERLDLMGGALQRYQHTVRQRGETSFHAVYPIMLTLLERGMAYCTK
jgi:hypothetical protein